MLLVSTSRNIVTQVFLRLDTRDLSIWIKGKYLGGGNFGKVIYIYIILKVYFRIQFGSSAVVLICMFPIFGLGGIRVDADLKIIM